jgi:riboflavin kinase/FMN adenylyltransferase
MKEQRDKMALPITLIGEVVRGKGLGRTVGMPTANLHVLEGELPEPGVYAGKVEVQGSQYKAVTNIGKRPSVDQDQQITVESYIIDFEGDLYGREMKLELVKYLRPVQKFSGLEGVLEQVKKDIVEAKKYI